MKNVESVIWNADAKISSKNSTVFPAVSRSSFYAKENGLKGLQCIDLTETQIKDIIRAECLPINKFHRLSVLRSFVGLPMSDWKHCTIAPGFVFNSISRNKTELIA